LATRVSFHGPSAQLGNKMLRDIDSRQHWSRRLCSTSRAYIGGKMCHFPEGLTVLVEIIHSNTKVHVDYGGKEQFVLIGAYYHKTMEDIVGSALVDLGAILSIPVATRWRGTSLDELKTLMRDKKITNREGIVARFENGVRVKYKFETYIGLMVASKLSYAYLMNRLLANNLEKMLLTLPEEIIGRARDMVARIQAVVCDVPGDEKARREYLYGLDPEKQKNQYYRGICRKFLKSVDASFKKAGIRKSGKRAA